MKLQTHHHTSTCRKKEGVKCRFHFPWPPSKRSLIVRPPESDTETTFKRANKLLSHVLETLLTMGDLRDCTEEMLLSKAGISKKDYYKSLAVMSKHMCMLYKRKPNETNISPYNTVLLSLWKANMNIQFVTGIYGVIMYLTTYLCKAERSMGELMKKACKEAHFGGTISEQLRPIGQAFRKNREVSLHEAIKRVCSLPLRRSNNDVVYIPTGPKKSRTRMLKPKHVLETMHEDDEDIYAANIVDKYAKRPDQLQGMCLAEFASTYKHTKADDIDPESVESYTAPVTGHIDVPNSNIVINLKDDFGKMRKRNKPCIPRWHSVSELKDAEGHFLRLLQLYLPWRDEDELMQSKPYKDTYEQFQQEVELNRQVYEPYADIDYADLADNNLTSSSDSEDEDYSFMNPSLLECTEDVDDIPNIPSSIPYRRVDLSLPTDVFHEMCASLNDEQRELLNYVLMWCHFTIWPKNGVENNPFHIFLTGGAGVGKSHLTVIISEYIKRTLKYAGQSLDQPSVCITASTGKAASEIGGTTLHSAFNLPVKSKSLHIKHGELQRLQNKYKCLKVIITDEISMINDQVLAMLDKRLQVIFENDSDFGGISILAVGDLLQLPPVCPKDIFADPSGSDYSTLVGSLWKKLFKLVELKTIVRQASDPRFAQILSRIREGIKTEEDKAVIESLNNKDISSWTQGYVKLFLTNHLAGIENRKALNNMPSEKIVVRCKDSRRDQETGVCDINVPESTSIYRTANLPYEVVLCVGARFMLTVNLNVDDKLINGSIGTIVHLQISTQCPLNGIIFIKFDDPNAGNSSKNQRLPEHLRDCVPIKAQALGFDFRPKSGRYVSMVRRQYPGILAHAITIHKSQGSTYEYMVVDMNTTGDEGGKGKSGMKPGQAYTGLSRCKTLEGLALRNFDMSKVKVNEPALKEMERLRDHCKLKFVHPLQKEGDNLISLLNIRSWAKHVDHFLLDPNFLQKCGIFCFTETYILQSQKEINSFNGDWTTIHKATTHGLAFCHNQHKVAILQEYDMQDIEAMAFHVLYQGNLDFIIILVYRAPGAVHNFIDILKDQMRRLPKDKRMILLGDFNLDQRDQSNIVLFSELRQEFSLSQRSNSTTHIDGGILDLVFDNKSSSEVSFIPTVFSDHCIIIVGI